MLTARILLYAVLNDKSSYEPQMSVGCIVVKCQQGCVVFVENRINYSRRSARAILGNPNIELSRDRKQPDSK